MDGHDQTEIDAMVELHPEALRQAVFDAIRPFYDLDLDCRVFHAEGAWQMKARKALKDHPGYKAANKRIRAAWKTARTGASKLHIEQDEAARILRDSIPPSLGLPDAQPDGAVASALFDSEANFVTGTRQLIRRKKLTTGEAAQ
jgi:hypothetical protein